MTAEIAILNKTAVALAADSAVTISAGQKEEKIFDSADKLFELSNHNAIGIMIYNGMSFMETPLPSLIRAFRSGCVRVQTVEEAATAFLKFLHKEGRTAPNEVKDDVIRSILMPLFKGMFSRYTEKVTEKISQLAHQVANTSKSTLTGPADFQTLRGHFGIND